MFSQIFSASFSSRKITAISDSLNISSIAVLHLFLPVFLPLKVFSITCLPHVPWNTSPSSLSPHLQGFQTTLLPMLLIFLAFPQVYQLLYLLSVEVLQIPIPASSLVMPISPDVSAVPMTVPALGQAARAPAFRYNPLMTGTSRPYLPGSGMCCGPP